MACDIANGRTLECKESIGGIRNVYFANNGAGGSLTIDADGDLTGLGTSSSDVYKYELIPQGSSFDEVVTVSEENGTVFYEQTLTLSLPNLTSASLKALKILGQGRFQVYVEDNNIDEATGQGKVYLAGAFNGMTVTGGNVGRGQAFGDMNGYNLTLTGREQRAALLCTAGTTAGALQGLTNPPTENAS